MSRNRLELSNTDKQFPETNETKGSRGHPSEAIKQLENYRKSVSEENSMTLQKTESETQGKSVDSVNDTQNSRSVKEESNNAIVVAWEKDEGYHSPGNYDERNNRSGRSSPSGDEVPGQMNNQSFGKHSGECSLRKTIRGNEDNEGTRVMTIMRAMRLIRIMRMIRLMRIMGITKVMR